MTDAVAGYALITGASRGIGAAFADALARRGRDLVLVARTDLTDQAAALADRYGVRVATEAVDLSDPTAVAELAPRLAARGLTVDLLVNNAGMATHGRFETIDAAADHRLVMLNTVAVLDLCHAFLPDMVARHRGAVVNVASLGAFQPAPYVAAYAASKAFVLSLSEALASELAGSGVQVQALCPGPVDTAFFAELGSTDAAVGQYLTAEAVVASCLAHLARDARVVVPGWQNALAAQASRVLPRRVLAGIAKRAVGPGQ